VKLVREYFDILKYAPLFSGIESDELEIVLKCIGAEIKTVAKNDIILLAGDRPQKIGVVVAGQLHVVRDDRDGNRSLITAITSGGIFAETLCYAGVLESPVTVMADTDATIVLFGFSRIVHSCSNACPFHSKLIKNMLGIIAGKNIMLQDRMEIISLKSVRAKVARYLESFVPAQGSSITIPLNREKLADYLCVERSALSHELSKMKRDGLIEYRKNNFILKYPAR